MGTHHHSSALLFMEKEVTSSELSSLIPSLDRLRENAPDSLDLTSADDLGAVETLAEQLLAENDDPAVLGELEKSLAGSSADSGISSDSAAASTSPSAPLGLAVGAKLALSKAVVSRISEPVFLSMIFAVYKENNRIRRPDEHAHGEDFLRHKVRQLEWLFSDAPHIGWELVVVDDGCPDGSGAIAKKIAESESFGEKVRVLFLADAIKQGLPVSDGIDSTADSQKGGAILHGLWETTRTERENNNHIVIYTDADLSTHLGQTGLLLDALLSGTAEVAIGSRRERTSVVVKTGGRNTRGKLFIYLWKQLISVLPGVIDTQCAFKAFRAEVAREIVLPAIEKKFAFDVELLIKTALRNPEGIVRVPIAWIDSEAASTTTDLEPYLPMLQSIVCMYRTYLPEDSSTEAEPFAKLIESLDVEWWNRLCENVPAEIANREPYEFGSTAHVSAEQLGEAAAG